MARNRLNDPLAPVFGTLFSSLLKMQSHNQNGFHYVRFNFMAFIVHFLLFDFKHILYFIKKKWTISYGCYNRLEILEYEIIWLVVIVYFNSTKKFFDASIILKTFLWCWKKFWNFILENLHLQIVAIYFRIDRLY